MSVFIYPAQQVTIPGAATEATLLLVEANTADTVTELQTLNAKYAADFGASSGAIRTAALLGNVNGAADFANGASTAQTLRVMPASDAVVAATQSGTWNINNISGTVSLPTGAATEASLASLIALNELDVVDQIDTTPLLDVSVTNIPASASLPVEVVASTAASVKKVTSVEDIGEFIGLYTGAASSEVLKAILPLGGGEMQVDIPASTRISLRHMKNTAITSGFIGLNFQG